MKLTLNACAGDLAEIDLGEPDNGLLDDGDLSTTGGNLYIEIDGKEWGSLFFHTDADGRLVIELGQYDRSMEQWETRNPLTVPVDDTDTPAPAAGVEHGPVPATWFAPGVWPTCACGLDPRDNGVLTAHWRERGFEVVDDHGTLRTIQLGETTHAGSHS